MTRFRALFVALNFFLLLMEMPVLVFGAQERMTVIRNDTHRLLTYIQELPVAKDKVAPLNTTSDASNASVEVLATVNVIYIQSLNDVQQTVVSSSLIVLEWRDPALQWDPRDFGGVEMVVIPAEYIWTPRFVVCNALDLQVSPTDLARTLLVFSNGTVQTTLFTTLETVCPLDHRLFPFDEQHCPILLCDFTYAIRWILTATNLVNHPQAKPMFVSNWEVLNITAHALSVLDFNVVVPLVMLHLRRKTLFYAVCLVLPLAITPFLNLLVFLEPLQDGEKVSYLMSIIVSTSVFIGSFSDTMPRGLVEMPGAMMLLVFLIGQSLFVLLATVLVLRLFQAEQLACRSLQPASPRGCHELSLSRVFSRSCQVSPDTEGKPEALPAGDAGDEFVRKRVKGGGVQVTARRLDGMLFGFTLVATTTALLLILFTQMRIENE